jgi:hypothetical protein
MNWKRLKQKAITGLLTPAQSLALVEIAQSSEGLRNIEGNALVCPICHEEEGHDSLCPWAALKKGKFGDPTT